MMSLAGLLMARRPSGRGGNISILHRPKWRNALASASPHMRRRKPVSVFVNRHVKELRPRSELRLTNWISDREEGSYSDIGDSKVRVDQEFIPSSLHHPRHLNHQIRLRNRNTRQDKTLRLFFLAEPRPFDRIAHASFAHAAQARAARSVAAGPRQPQACKTGGPENRQRIGRFERAPQRLRPP